MDLSSHGIVALVRNKEGKFLLLEDARELMRGFWAPPHGRCEPSDQSEEQSVVREVKEETSLEVVPIKKLRTQAADTKVKTVSFWLVETTDTEILLDAESSNYAWVTIDEALSMKLYPGTESFFKDVKAGLITINEYLTEGLLVYNYKMKYSLLGKFTAQPGKQDELLKILLHAAELLQQNPDCIHYIVSTADNEDGIWIYETWTNKEAHDASLEPEEVKAEIAKVIPLVASMSKVAELQVQGGKGL